MERGKNRREITRKDRRTRETMRQDKTRETDEDKNGYVTKNEEPQVRLYEM